MMRNRHLPEAQRYDWQTDAACQDVGDLMFPTPGDTHGIEAAKDVCRACPVINACLRDALHTEGNASAKNRFGIRADRTPRQRRTLYSQGIGRQETQPEDRQEAAARRLTAEGLTAREIADRLHVSARTVDRWRTKWKTAV